MPQAAPQRHILLVDDDRALRHVLSALLQDAGHRVESASDGPEALEMLGEGSSFDLVLLDIGLPSMSGLDVLARVRGLSRPPLVIVMTADDTSATVLEAVRRQAYRYLRKPFPPSAIVDVVNEASTTPTAALSIEVISAKPEWLELVAPCTLEMADRIQSFVMHLEANLSEAVREAVAHAFRELLTNAIEWGGKLDPNRKVRIACVRTPRLLLYRIADPGEGFDISILRHAAIMNPDDPMRHLSVREEKGLRPGGFGLAMTRSLVDDLIYNEARNEVLLIKHLDDAGDDR
jgi:CheY-like chemotaxis protein